MHAWTQLRTRKSVQIYPQNQVTSFSQDTIDTRSPIHHYKCSASVQNYTCEMGPPLLRPYIASYVHGTVYYNLSLKRGKRRPIAKTPNILFGHYMGSRLCRMAVH